MQGDCLDLMPTIPDGSVDMVATDPPYGMNFQSNWAVDGPHYAKIAGDDKPDLRWLSEAHRVLKDGGALAMFCNWGTSHVWREGILAAGFRLKSQVIWDREHHGMGDLKGAFAPMHDIVWYASKGRRVFANGRPKSVMRHKRPSPTQDFGHPTCKPVGLMEDLINAVSDGTNGLVLDPFMGSGTTGVACINTNRRFIGIERDPAYFEIAKRRIDESHAQPAQAAMAL
jgi:site-specific DNA-methyltransferase (adenine-specific)